MDMRREEKVKVLGKSIRLLRGEDEQLSENVLTLSDGERWCRGGPG